MDLEFLTLYRIMGAIICQNKRDLIVYCAKFYLFFLQKKISIFCLNLFVQHIVGYFSTSTTVLTYIRVPINPAETKKLFLPPDPPRPSHNTKAISAGEQNQPPQSTVSLPVHFKNSAECMQIHPGSTHHTGSIMS